MDEQDSYDSLIAAVARIPAQTWSPPRVLDEYELLKPLGRGGMGSVWLAHDRLLDREVAIKFIAHAEPDGATRERFAVEARAAARLQHANVVTVYRFGEVAGRPYIVTEYIRGVSLEQLAKPIAWDRALEIGIALARGLAAAHRRGIVHRDIKPANAILAADGDVKLVDFGLAKVGVPGGELPRGERGATVVDDRAATLPADGVLTAPGAIAGTPRYYAPEVRAGDPATRRSDVYQVGCVLYELVTSRAPLLDLAGGAAAATSEELPSIGPRVPGDGARFAAVVDRCLRRDPETRFPSAEDLREALERLAAPAFGGELPEGNPYRGLIPFEAEHRTLFFGRGPETRALVERLRSDGFVLVTGDSGVGKSSLCRAGVIPHVVDGALGDGRAWQVIQLVPGAHPVATLAAQLAAASGIDEREIATMLRDEPARVARELRRVLGTTRGLLVFVDQLEELTTLTSSEDVEICGQALAHLAAGIPGVRVLATVRSDFLARLAEVPALGVDLARALYLLPTLSSEGAREAIVGPARAKGAEFESDELVATLVASVTAGAGTRVELPLLAFTLAQLWDARDPQTQMITARSLDSIGGVRGALARHADGVLAALLPTQRAVARASLLRLITPERTRVRRPAAELLDRTVLDALVRGRLVVARGEDPPTFELAHERLIDGWPTLASWLAENTEAQAVHARLATAVADWTRLGGGDEGLWSERLLASLVVVPAHDLTASEAEFVTRSQRAVRRRRITRTAIAVAVPAIVAAVYGGARFVARRDLARHVASNVAEADRELATARAEMAESRTLATEAYAELDRGELDGGEHAWARARTHDTTAQSAYGRASRALEAAFLLDTGRDDVRHELAQVTYERLDLADRDHREGDRAELATRLALYDDALAASLAAPAKLAVTPRPAGTLALADDSERPLPAELPPGSHVILARAPGRATVRLPIVLAPGEDRRFELALPREDAVPAGFIYVAPGRFRTGSRDDEPVRLFFGAVPMHELASDAYLVARTETTYAQWIEYLDTLPPDERVRRAPHIEASATVQQGGALELRRDASGWELRVTPASVEYVARAGAPIEYRDRTSRRRQNWLAWPVSGITPDDARAYATWLDRTGRVPGARVCTEREWERAARGADGRSYPHGDTLAPDDANIDVTYGQLDGGFGPDEVGSHPASTSPFGLVDTSGNVWEITTTPSGTGFVMHGGGFYTNATTAHLANRQEITSSFRHLHVGVRMCARSPAVE